MSTEAPTRVVARARLRRQARSAAASVGVAAVCFTVFCLSLALGEVDIPVPDVVPALFGLGDPGVAIVVAELRLPRALAGVLAGAAFGLAGAIFQAVLRNPLASPDIIGITQGASAGAVIALLVLGLGGFAVSAAAFVGALGTAAVMYGLAWRGGVAGYRLVLVGIAMAAMLGSVVSYCLTRSDVYAAHQALIWLTGSLNAKSWTTVQILGACLVVLVPVALLAGSRLIVLQFGDDTARELGVPVERSRMWLIAVAAALAAVATAAVGPVMFVAFVAGPIARRLAGDVPTALVTSALVGALVMTASDVLAQHAVPGASFAVGVVTAIMGAPYLLWLLAGTNRSGRGG